VFVAVETFEGVEIAGVPHRFSHRNPIHAVHTNGTRDRLTPVATNPAGWPV
jgi:hypothetical protein